MENCKEWKEEIDGDSKEFGPGTRKDGVSVY